MFAVNSRKQVVVCVLSIFMITFRAFTPSTVFVQAKQVPIPATRTETQHVELGESIPAMEQASDTSVGAVKNQQTTTAESASPIIFIENVGQFDPRADFQAQANGVTTYFSEDAIWYTLLEPPSNDPNDDPHNAALDRLVEENQKPRKGVNLKVSLVGSNPRPTIEPFNKVATSFSYFTGSDISNWQTDVPVWGGIRYVDIYPGMNLQITSEQNRLLWQFVVTDASRFYDQNNQVVQQGIRIKIAGHQRLQTRNDTLDIATDVGTLSLPIIRVNDVELLPEVDKNGELIIQIPAQTSKSLGTFKTVSYIIPTNTELNLLPFGQSISTTQTTDKENVSQQSPGISLIYSAYFGTKYTLGDAIAVDNDGAVYVAGNVGWDDFPNGTGVFYLPGASSISYESFVAKIDLESNQLIYTAFFKTKPAYPGCDNTGFVGGIAVDNNKSVYVVGTTGNPDFPTTAGVIDGQLTDQCPGNPHYFYEERADGFILKLNAAGNQLLYSTYLGGSDYDRVDGVFVGEDGSAYVAGSTYTNGLSDLFITKLSPAADQQEFFTYVGGNDLEFTWGNLKVGNDGSIYLSGTTKSSDFPATADAYITSYSNSSSCNSSCYNAFALKLDSTGNTLMYATYLGEVGSGYATDLDVDETGHAYISGFIRGGADFPHTQLLGPISAPSSGMDGFVVKLAPDGKSAVYSDLIGGTGSDTLWAISVSHTGNAFLVGDSSSANFPITSDALDSSVEEFGADLIIAELDPNGSQLTYATYLGGSGWDYMSYHGAPLDSNGNINIFVRNTESTDFPTNRSPIGNGTNGSNEFGWWTAAIVRLSTNSPAYDCSGTAVSPIAQVVLDVVGNEQKYCGNHYDNQTDDKLITLPPGQDAFQKFGTLAETARHEVDFVTMGWDSYDDELGNNPGTIFLQGIKNLYTAVLANPEDYPGGVRVRILLGLKYYEATDCQDQRVIVMNDLDRLGIFPNGYFSVEVAAYRDAKQDKCRARDQLLGSTHSHVKMMIVDGKDVITGGYNMHYNYLGVDPNIPVVHDMGVQISGPIAQDALDIFYGLWMEAYRCDQHATNVCTQESTIQTIELNPAVLTTTVTGDEVVFSLFRDDTNKTADNAIEAAISAASSEVNIIQNRFTDTIYGDTPQYVTGILNAIDKDGVDVNLLVSGGNGRAEGMLDLANNIEGVCILYNQIQAQDPLDLPRFKFRFSKFINPTHTKALSIDDAFIIVGSQNFDPSAWGDNSFSFGDLAEYSLGVDSDQAASDFQTKFTNEWNAAGDLRPCLGVTGPFFGSTLQDSIDQAAPGTAIFIPAGVFTGSVIIDKPLVLVGAGTNETIIQPDDSEPAFQIRSSDVAIANLKISGGGGYGIELIDSSSSSLNNILITRVVFEDNIQGGVLAQGLIPGSPMNYSIENNTFIGGADGIVVDMLETQAESSIVRNNIFSGQSNTPVHIISADDSHVEYSYNLFDDCGLGDCATNWVQGSINALSNTHDNLFDLDPLFTSPENGAYQLSTGSPAIDAGDPDLYHDFFFDGDDDGLVRIDMGAFEYAPVANVAPVVNAGNDQTITLGDDVAVNATYSDANNTENHSARIDWGDEISEDVPVDMTGPGTGDVAGQHTYASAGTYTVEVCVTDIYGAVGCDTATIVVNNAFPLTPILDDFNRTDGAIGNNWSGNTSGYNISSNQLLVKSKNANLDIYWNNASFGPDQEVYFTFSSVSSTALDQDLLLKAQDTSSWGAMIDVQYDAAGQRVIVWTFAQGQSWVQYGADIPVTFVSGDQFGARALADGTVEVYRNGVLIATRDITSWPYYASGGYLGLWFGDAKNVLIDDFGGGNIP